MNIRAACRVCFGDSVKMHTVTSPQLQEVYEKLTDTKVQSEGIRLLALCYLCYSQLRRTYMFSKAARRSETLLSALYHGGNMFTPEIISVVDRPAVHSYSITPIEYVDLHERITENSEKNRVDVKKEILDATNEAKEAEFPEEKETEYPNIIKADPESDLDNHQVDTALTGSSDSEDDLPLNNLKKEKVVRKKRAYIKRTKLDAREVLVPKEQQLQEVLNRSTSINYLNSPHRCALCYRGFLNHTSYKNHLEKHDERSGAHECDVCRARYRTARLLRKHTYMAHARRYRCNKCGHHSHTAHQAADHERWHNGHTYECQLCGQKFLKRTSYLTHIRKCHPTDHVCNLCGERFVGKHGLLMHKSKSHNKGREEEGKEDPSPKLDRFCSMCDIQFASMDAWKRHILTSVKHTMHMEQTSVCAICSAPIQGSVGEHVRQHARRPPPSRPPAPPGDGTRLQCGQCPQSFLVKSKLTAHVKRVHLGLKYNKNIVCEVCGKKCTSNASLKYHQRTHTGERPHPCESCGKRFSDSNQLRIHTRVHTGERPYCCPHCAKRFAQKPALNRHYRVHTGAKPYACELCSKSFSQSNSLKVHVRAVHLKLQTNRRGKGALETAPSAPNWTFNEKCQ